MKSDVDKDDKSSQKFADGAIVQLKSGSPTMTVKWFGNYNTASCKQTHRRADQDLENSIIENVYCCEYYCYQHNMFSEAIFYGHQLMPEKVAPK